MTPILIELLKEAFAAGARGEKSSQWINENIKRLGDIIVLQGIDKEEFNKQRSEHTRSVIKLDSSFSLYIHGNGEKASFDKDKQGSFLKIYFDNAHF